MSMEISIAQCTCCLIVVTYGVTVDQLLDLCLLQI